jgi:hypothetical protein
MAKIVRMQAVRTARRPTNPNMITSFHQQPSALSSPHLPMPSKSPAQTLLEKAEKKANSSTGWFSSSSTKFEEAGDLYQQAANSFKLEKLFREAGDAFSKEAECREKCSEANDAANAWWNAAKAYKRGYPDRALINCLHLISTKDSPPSSRCPSIVTNRYAFNAGRSLPSGC